MKNFRVGHHEVRVWVMGGRWFGVRPRIWAGRMYLPGRVTSTTGGCEEPAVRLTHRCTRVRRFRTWRFPLNF
jgi:hypothetical protein